MNDDELLKAIAESAKRGKQAERVAPLDDLSRARIARSIAASRKPKRRGAVFAGAAGVLALAAALLLFIRRPQSELPAYEMVVLGGAREIRGADTAPSTSPLRLRRGDRFEVQLTPTHATHGPLVGRALLARGASSIPFGGAIEIAPEGGARLAGTLDDFPGVTPGASELVVILGRPGAVERASLEAAPDRTVQRVPIVVE